MKAKKRVVLAAKAFVEWGEKSPWEVKVNSPLWNLIVAVQRLREEEAERSES